ncbi:unnamed protein product [Trichogramma brassicae]|uniref:Reverse transcriptase domain-containing protein n=1 Tax=Trichogramma brassicae TaxID=86971 RepID=A0A6H5J696_9HYME|nr:unnamed protein product [Trichogramma brassicae]
MSPTDRLQKVKNFKSAYTQATHNTRSQALSLERATRSLAKSRVKIDENANEIDRLKSEIHILKKAGEHYADMCEIRFGGLLVPDDIASTEVVASILKVLKCDESASRIVSVRKWMPPRPRTASGAVAANLSLVARFTSPVARDAVMSCTYRLANVTCGSVFGTAHQDRITPLNFTHTLASILQTSQQRVDPHRVQDGTSLDVLVTETTSALFKTLEVLAPLRSVTIKPKARPWITPELRSTMRSRDRAYRRARRHPTELHIYRESRSAVQNMLDSAKNRFLSMNIGTAADSSACWRALRGLGLSRDAKPSPLLLFSPDKLNSHQVFVSCGSMPLSEELVRHATSLPVDDTIPGFTLHATLARSLSCLSWQRFWSALCIFCGLLDPHQFGFRPEHSAQTAILDLTEAIRHAIDKHKVSLVVSFDFSKAFDSIPHTLIIKKLRLIGCTASAIDWFASYLSGRSQAIRLSDEPCSSFMTTTAGVPQGSVLGPLLFLVFINYLSARLSSSQHMIYADDKQIFCSDLPARAHILLDRTNSDISVIVAWAEDNGISLNSGQTGAMLCGSQFYVNALKDSTPPLFVRDAQLQMIPELIILGLKLTLTLGWGPQVSLVCSSVHYALYSLRYYRHALKRSLRKNLVESLIFPIFDYGSSVFHDLNKSQSLKLHRLHNACVRYVYGTIPYRAHVTPYRLALGWLSAQRRRDYNTIILEINIITRQSPRPLANLFSFQANRLLHRAARRQPSRALTHKTAQTQALHNSFAYAATRLLNSLPFLEDPRHPPRSLRQLVYAHLFELDVQDWKLQCYTEQLEYEPQALRNLLPPI